MSKCIKCERTGDRSSEDGRPMCYGHSLLDECNHMHMIEELNFAEYKMHVRRAFMWFYHNPRLTDGGAADEKIKIISEITQ